LVVVNTILHYYDNGLVQQISIPEQLLSGVRVLLRGVIAIVLRLIILLADT